MPPSKSKPKSSPPAASSSGAKPSAKAPRASGAKPSTPDSKSKGRSSTSEAPATAQTPPAARPARGRVKPVDLADALVNAFETSERANQYLLEQLDPSIWACEAPVGKGRVIRGVFAHIHNVRRLWLARRGEEASAPPKVDRETLTQDGARAALEQSHRAVVRMVREALEAGGHLADFKPDVAGFVGYAIAHEAHHRGQICMLARILGKPLPQARGYELWNWRRLAEEAREARSAPEPQPDTEH